MRTFLYIYNVKIHANAKCEYINRNEKYKRCTSNIDFYVTNNEVKLVKKKVKVNKSSGELK